MLMALEQVKLCLNMFLFLGQTLKETMYYIEYISDNKLDNE